MVFDGRLLAGVTILDAVIEAGSFVRAGDALGLTASGVSRAVARLEARVGARLLDRTTRSLALTDDGHRFYERIRPHLIGIEEAAGEVAGATKEVRGRLRVNIDPLFSRLVLAGQIGGFLARHPGLTLELITREHMGDLVADGIDMAVRFGDLAGGSMIARKLADIRVLTVAAPAYLAKHGRPAHPSELTTHECIQFRDPANGRPFDWFFQRGTEILPVRTRGQMLLTDAGTMIAECEAGSGIAQVLDIGMAEPLAAGRLIDIFPDWPGERHPLYAFHPSRQHPPARVRAFTDFVQAVLARPMADAESPVLARP